MVTLVVVSAGAAPVGAQQAQPDTPPLTSTLPADVLRDLPHSDNLFSLLETAHAEVVSDHFSGGVNAGEAARLGGFLTSWTQTSYRLGAAELGGGVAGLPAFVPGVSLWERVGLTSGMAPPDVTGPGVLVTLAPQPPTASWHTTVAAATSGSALAAGRSARGPAIASLKDWKNASVLTSGPLAPGGAGMVLAASTTRASQVERGRRAAATASVDSLFAHIVLPLGRARALRSVVWTQATSAPTSRSTAHRHDGPDRRQRAVHLQSTWETATASGSGWRLFGGMTQRSWTDSAAGPMTISWDRVVDGVVPDGSDAASGHERTWSVGIRTVALPAAGRAWHTLQFGADARLTSARRDALPGLTVRERVNGIPAREWTYSAAPQVNRHRRELAAFVADTIRPAERLTVDAALRFDHASGDSARAAAGVSWNTVMPRLSIRWTLAQTGVVTLYTGFSRMADTVTLDLLEFGDPASPYGEVRRWDGEVSGPIVALVGPGTGPDGGLTSVDPGLRRPITNEVVLGIESAPSPWLRLRLTAITKRTSDHIALVNAGAPVSAYSVVRLADPGANLLDPVDDQLLPVYDRLPGTFGADRYVLTNPDQPVTTFRGVVFSAESQLRRLSLLAGATIGKPDAPAANRGFTAEENDSGLVGELYTNPNAATHAVGEVFADRQCTVKIAGVYRPGADVRIGGVARYQDGQPFARMLVVPDLNQGTEAVRAFRNGKSRFTYTGTLDLRFEKGFALGGRQGRAAIVVDVFNAVNMAKEVEEWVVSGPRFREVTAVQPPRTIHLGVRYDF